MEKEKHWISKSNSKFVVGAPGALRLCVRYYELGPDDPPYAAKFYDCCGAEDPEASGCTTNFHVSYDED
ncbi:hypothetical protein GLYMA_11G108600v4 [Glycine max]|uniref:Uncharacterized protein n=2 Tax=Glycine subgen. Soja TaxID=1462606 RepID=A0A0R0HFD5_SOYBN|nr:hypothetical protein GLYMA_11G108600v4 [Glycine max]RZB79360.1 hypothetical protein D0Y65_029586 [Glycine soja]